MRIYRQFISPIIIVFACLLIWGRMFDPRLMPAGADFLNLLYPHALLVREALASGDLPLWNWHTWGGSPLLAAMQCASLYPPMWVALLLPLPWGLQFYILVHILSGALGAYLLAQHTVNLGRIPACFAAIAYVGSSFFLGHLEQVNVVASLSYAPWLVLFSLRVLESGRSLLILALTVALSMLAGHPQDLIIALVAVETIAILDGLFRLMKCCPDRQGVIRSGWFRRWIFLQAAIVLGILLSAAQVFPTQELSQLSERVWPYANPHEPHLRWTELLAKFVPRYFNNLYDNEVQDVRFAELHLYSGIVSLPLFLLGALAVFQRRHGDKRGIILLITWIVFLNYALGAHSFVTPLLFRAVPFFSHTRGAARGLNIEVLLYGLVAGAGLQYLISRLSHRNTYRTMLFGSVVLGLLVTDFSLTHRPELRSLVCDRELLGVSPPVKSSGPDRTYRFMAADSDYYLDRRPQSVSQRLFRFQPNAHVFSQLSIIDGYEEGLLPLRSYANFLRRFNRNLRNDSPDASLLALLGVSSMFTEYPLTPSPDQWSRQWARPQQDRYTLWQSMYKHSLIVPSNMFNLSTRNSYQIPDKQEGEYWKEPTGRDVVPHPMTVVPPDQWNLITGSSGIRIDRVDTNRIDISYQGSGTGSFYFLQPYYPGWKISASETSPAKRLTPINGLMSRFTIAPGKGAKIYFSPFSFRLGVFISLISAAILATPGLLYKSLSRRYNRHKNPLQPGRTGT